MMTFSQIQSSNLRDQVVEQIRTAIIEGLLKPNDHIVENVLTQQLGVSRTPVREALILLEQDGLVVSYPNRGSFVRNFTVQDVKDIFSMRTTLENFAAECNMEMMQEADFQHLEALIVQQKEAIQTNQFKVVRSIDMSFHRFLVEKSGHSLLIHNWQQIVAQIAAILYIRAEIIPNYDERLAIRDHTSIVEAYRTHDLNQIMTLNRQINGRVSSECQLAVDTISSGNK
jgi:DNA-binding GntR family transcriptional regulator